MLKLMFYKFCSKKGLLGSHILPQNLESWNSALLFHWKGGDSKSDFYQEKPYSELSRSN